MTNSWARHCDGSSGGAGITTIWEFGIIWVQLFECPDNPTLRVSTKLGVLSKPNIEYGNCNAKYADWESCAQTPVLYVPSWDQVLYPILGPGKLVPKKKIWHLY